MKINKNLPGMLVSTIALAILMSLSIQAQLLVNEVESDPPNDVGDRCQYVELRGTPNSTIAANTYFISVNSDQDNFGFLSTAVALGGLTVGANGTITLNNTVGGACPNRTFDPGTTVVNYFNGLTLGQVSEGFYVVTSATTLNAGQDIDSNDDGVENFPITYIDGFNYLSNPEEQYKYGPGPVLNTTFGGDVPDATTRFPGNNTPNSAAAFYWGELASSPEETTVYAAPLSANFPQGGMLTPGGANVPTAAPAGLARADFDGDGRTDLSVFRPSEGNWYLNQSTAGFAATSFGLTGDRLVPGDYDGDNKTDVAVFRASASDTQPDFWVLRSGNSTLLAVSWGTSGDIPVTADYDNDDKTDIAVFRPSSNTWYILNSSGTPASTTAVFGQSGDVPVTGDFDGDGKGDLTVYRNGTWMSQLSGGGTINTALGTTGDILVPADYDGDDKDDIAVFTPSNGVWTFVASNGGATNAVQWGTMGDIPVPGDYDGDGRDDQAIYRNGQWWLRRSTSGQLTASFGLGSDLPAPRAYIP